MAWRACVAGALVAVCAVPVAGASGAAYTPVLGPFAAPKVNVHHYALGADRLSVVRRNGSYVVKLRDVSTNTSAVRAKPRNRGLAPAFRMRTRTLPSSWFGRLGFNPNMAVTYTVNGARRTHYLRDAGRARYDARTNSLITVLPASRGNRSVVAGMRPSAARNLTVVLEPTPIRSGPVKVGRADPKRETQSTSTTTTGYIPASPNSAYSVPYSTALGTGGQTWKNLLSANGAIMPACESFTASQSGGDVVTSGSIQVYETAAEVQQALSVAASMTYKVPLAKVTVDLGYSESSAQSTSSFYAVAMVQWNGAYVNLGAPMLTNQYAPTASGIDSTSDALGLIQQCGDSYPTGYQQGAMWASVLQITMASEEQAQDAYASITETFGTSFLSTSATQGFSEATSEYASSSTITETDECWGPSSCTVVPGYQTPSSAGTNYTAAMDIFTSNYNLMYQNLGSLCSPTATTTGCVTTVQYAPLQQAFTTADFAPGSPAQTFTSTAEGLYGVFQNLQAWQSQYQAMITGDPNNGSNTAYQAYSNQLTDQANSCMNGLSSQDCAVVVQQCASGMTWNPTYVQYACQPNAFTSNNALANMPNPFYLSNTTQAG